MASENGEVLVDSGAPLPGVGAAEESQLHVRVRLVVDKADWVPTDKDRTSFCYLEPANTHDINERYPVHKKALEQWERSERVLFDIITRRLADLRDSKGQIYNLVWLFLVFIGVVLTSVPQLAAASQIELCSTLPFPILLTGLALCVTISGILFFSRDVKSIEAEIDRSKVAQQVFLNRIKSLQRYGPQKFNFANEKEAPPYETSQPKILERIRRWSLGNIDLVFLIACLVVFAGLFMWSYLVILCNKR